MLNKRERFYTINPFKRRALHLGLMIVRTPVSGNHSSFFQKDRQFNTESPFEHRDNSLLRTHVLIGPQNAIAEITMHFLAVQALIGPPSLCTLHIKRYISFDFANFPNRHQLQFSFHISSTGKMRDLRRIPQEIYDFISQILSSSDNKNAADAFLCVERPENRLWRTIFKSDAWVEEAYKLGASPALVGPKIGMIGKENYKDTQRHHILLVTNDWSGDLQYDTNLLFQSLRDGYRYNKKKYKVTLPETRFTTPDNRKMIIPEIVLYLHDAIRGSDSIVLPKRAVKRLFEKKFIRTHYSFAREKKICLLDDKNVYGIGGKISEPGALIPICVMYLFDSAKKWRLILEVAGHPPLAPIMNKNSNDIYGWTRK